MFHRTSREKLVPVLFFIVVFLIGVFVFRDFGVHYDETHQIEIGVTNYRYINQGDPDLLNFQDRYYGPFFEMPLLIFSNHIPSPGMIYFRHFAVFLVFFSGLIGFYYLARRLLGIPWLALLAAILLVTSPRIFADAFYNSKDIPFMVIFLLGMMSLIHWLDLLALGQAAKPVWMAAIFHAFMCAAVVTTRIPGIVLVGITTGLILLEMIVKPANWKRNARILACYLVLTFGFIILLMPILWHDPVGEFVNAIQQMSRYDLWKGTILFQGKIFPANNPVWNYLPVWIGITTPYLPLVSFILGGIWLLASALKKLTVLLKARLNNWRDVISMDGLIWMSIAAWLIIPVLGLIVFKSVLYDAWRQMFFVFPAILLIALYGIKKLYLWAFNVLKQRTLVLIGMVLVLFLGILEPVIFMVQNHPFENVYFNLLAGDSSVLRQRYDLDYWGLSNKQGIDYILANDPRQQIKLSPLMPAFQYVEYMLPAETASRIQFVDIAEADYFITNYRGHPDDFPFPEKYYSVFVRGTEIMTVYRLSDSARNAQISCP